MRFLTVIFLLGCAGSLKSQNNLVPNGDFESYTLCPTNEAQLYLATPWVSPSDNDINLSSTPDYFNQCATIEFCDVPLNLHAFQLAYSGVGYAGIVLFDSHSITREYIEIPLISTLLGKVSYHFEMYVNLSNGSSYTTDAIGVYFSDTLITGIPGYNPLPFIPQLNNASSNFFDTLSWNLVSGDYIANGNENFIIIGNFKDDVTTTTIENQTGYYNAAYCFIDDVSLSIVTGINELETANIIVYPNPATTEITVSGYSPAYLKLCNAVGQTVAESKSNKLYVGNLSQGLYVLQLFDAKGQQVKTEKVIVAK